MFYLETLHLVMIQYGECVYKQHTEVVDDFMTDEIP
jgi:hypothetical protein